MDRASSLWPRPAPETGSPRFSTVDPHREAVYTIVRNLCRTATDTEETLHEAFLTAWHDLRAFPSGVRFSTWLYSIATRTAWAYRMRRYHGKRTSNQLGALPPTFDGKGRLIARESRWPAVEETPAGRIDMTAALRDALESIDDPRIEVLFPCRASHSDRNDVGFGSRRARSPTVSLSGRPPPTEGPVHRGSATLEVATAAGHASSRALSRSSWMTAVGTPRSQSLEQSCVPFV